MIELIDKKYGVTIAYFWKSINGIDNFRYVCYNESVSYSVAYVHFEHERNSSDIPDPYGQHQ